MNDNAPIFRPHSPVVRVREHSSPHIITTLEATDRDSGIFGQVRFTSIFKMAPKVFCKCFSGSIINCLFHTRYIDRVWKNKRKW